jgi:hypothetical protein
LFRVDTKRNKMKLLFNMWNINGLTLPFKP